MNFNIKGLITGLALLTISAGALAGELKFDFRSDMESFSSNDVANKPGYRRYYLQTARLDYKGKVDDNTSYRMRVRLNKDLDKATNTRDSLNNTVDYFMVKTIVAEGTALSIGKFAGLVGGYEGLVAGSDVYFSSTALNELKDLRYYTGAGVEYKINENNTFTLHNANQDSDENQTTAPCALTTPCLKQSKSVTAMAFENTFSEGNHKFLLTYTVSPKVGSDVNNTFISAGLKMKFDTLMADLEYLSNSWADKTVVDKADVTNSIVAGLAMKGEFWTPKVKIESTTLNASGSKTGDVLGVSLIGEYKPVAENDFRYHVGVNQISTTPVGGDAAVTQTLIAGIKLGADFLK